MNKLHLLWIVPMSILFGMMFYSWLTWEEQMAIMKLLETTMISCGMI